MAARLSRTKIAAFIADKVLSEAKTTVLQQAAAYLIETRRTSELELLVRDVEAALAQRGVTVADVTTARPLTEVLRQQIGSLIDGERLHLRETIDPAVLGGLRIDLPGRRYDSTIARRLSALKAKKV